MQGYECAQSSIFNNVPNDNNASVVDNFVGGTPIGYNYSSSFTKCDFIMPFVDY